MLTYLKKRIQSFGYAFKGVFIFFRETPHAKIHLLAIVVITILGQYLSLSRMEWCIIVACMALVMVAEAINSAIEYVVDLASPDQHPLAAKAKDVAAGAVLLGVIFCGVVWGMIFIPKIFVL
jgi:diacylglycerol kinase